MVVLLVLLGFSVFLAGFTLYLKTAFVLNRAWGWWCLIFPPLSIVYYWRNWPASKESAFLQLGGLLTVLIAALFALSNPADSADVSSNKMSGVMELSGKSVHRESAGRPGVRAQVPDESMAKKAKESVKSTVLQISKVARQEGGNLISSVQKSRELAGQLNDEHFKPDIVTLREGRLRFKQGEKLFGDKELIVLLPEPEFKISSGAVFRFQATQTNGPEIHLSWLEGEDSVPETKIIKSGYSLDLELQQVTDADVKARIRFEYKDMDFSSKLAGSFIASKIEASSEVKSERAPGNDLAGPRQGTVSTEENIIDATPAKTEPLELTATQAQPEAVEQMTIKESTTPAAEQAEAIEATSSAEPAPAPKLVPHTDILESYLKPETAIVLQQLEPFWGRNVVITAIDGTKVEGLLKAVRKHQIAVELRVGAGTMEKFILVEKFKSVELK